MPGTTITLLILGGSCLLAALISRTRFFRWMWDWIDYGLDSLAYLYDKRISRAGRARRRAIRQYRKGIDFETFDDGNDITDLNLPKIKANVPEEDRDEDLVPTALISVAVNTPERTASARALQHAEEVKLPPLTDAQAEAAIAARNQAFREKLTGEIPVIREDDPAPEPEPEPVPVRYHEVPEPPQRFHTVLHDWSDVDDYITSMKIRTDVFINNLRAWAESGQPLELTRGL